MIIMENKNYYYFFTEKTFTEGLFESDEATIATKKDDCIRIMRGKDSTEIWAKQTDEKTEA